MVAEQYAEEEGNGRVSPDCPRDVPWAGEPDGPGLPGADDRASCGVVLESPARAARGTRIVATWSSSASFCEGGHRWRKRALR